jgi:hypothetical protein
VARKHFTSQKTATRYDAGMTVADWIALAFLVVATVASAAIAGVRGLRLWRTFRSFSGQAETALDTVMQGTAKAEERSATLTANQERLARATEHLKTSLAQLAVLRAAAAEANATFKRVRSVVPTK